MTKSPDFPHLDLGAAEPLYRQIYVRFRHAIAQGLLLPGARIPSARALALELGLARGTVDAAYSLLSAEGYVEAHAQAGTRVASALARHVPVAPAARPAGHALSPPDSPSPFKRPFQMGVPALDAFPRKIWAALGARVIRATLAEDMAYPPYCGAQALRIAIATYLRLARGIDCAPAQVFITSGYRNSLELVARALLRPGDGVWVEDPGYPPTGALLEQAGMKPIPVAVDGEGLRVAQGMAAAPGARAAIVTPAHQSPLCVSLSLARRLALLDWAAQARAWIVEDDYDGEFRHVGRPLPALQSLDREGRVLYAGTFSKVLFPAIRLAYLVVPEAQVSRFEQVCETFSSGGPMLMQAMVAGFMNEGHFARHIQRMRGLYGERRRMVATELEQVLGGHLHIEPQPGGMHMVLRMTGRSDRALAARMRRDGMAAHALSERSVLPQTASALLLGFTNIDTPAMARALGQRILRLL
ncbi:MAG TPA: DNA-binding protein [Janthinobacterium sp.]|nr:DNA-binding protein [Janthinobacterium sp.]